MSKKTAKVEAVETEWTIVNDADANDSFTIMAVDANDAARKALEELGWWVAAQ